MTERIEELETKVETHMEAYNRYVLEAAQHTQELILAQQKNTESIATLTEATQGLVDGWIVVNAFQRFVKWASGFAIVGAFFAWLGNKLL